MVGDYLDHWVSTPVAPEERSDVGSLLCVPHKLPRSSRHNAITMKMLAFCFLLSENIISGKLCDSSLTSTLRPFVKGGSHGH